MLISHIFPPALWVFVMDVIRVNGGNHARNRNTIFLVYCAGLLSSVEIKKQKGVCFFHTLNSFTCWMAPFQTELYLKFQVPGPHVGLLCSLSGHTVLAVRWADYKAQRSEQLSKHKMTMLKRRATINETKHWTQSPVCLAQYWHLTMKSVW